MVPAATMFELQAVGHSSVAYIQRGIHQRLTLGHAAQQGGADEVHDAYAVLATADFHDCDFRIGSFTNQKATPNQRRMRMTEGNGFDGSD